MKGMLLAAMVAIVTLGCSAQAQELPPNILFVLTDDMRYDQMVAMPQTTELLEGQGITFTRAYSVDPNCCPSRATILTGQYSHNHGVATNEAPDGGWHAFKPHEENTIATRLDGAGYTTALVGKYLNGYTNTTYVPPGWDFWRGKLGKITWKKRPGYYKVNADGVAQVLKRSSLRETAYYQQEAASFIEGHSAEPWFLYVAPTDPHSPRRHAREYRNAYRDAPVPQGVREKDQYRESLRSVRTVDDLVASLVAKLEETGQLERTYVVFTSDNGLLFGEHGIQGKRVPYEQATHIPLLIRGPSIPAGETREGLAGLHDLAPTFAQWGGASEPVGADGRSLDALIANGPWRDALLIEHHEGKRDWSAVRTETALYAEWRSGRAMGDATLSTRLESLKDCAVDSCRVAEGP